MRVLSVALLLGIALLAGVVPAALARGRSEGDEGSGYFVTFVARSCPSYSVIFANKARNDILESLKDLGPDTQYGNTGQLINPTAEEIPPQNQCVPLVDWTFTLGTGYESRAVTGPRGSLSKVTDPYPRAPIVTRPRTPLLDQDGIPDGREELAGATTIELTRQERAQASNPDQLWAQGGTPSDPVLAQRFPGPEYGFGALRCATDDLNGDNVEYIFFPAGVHHVFCYGLYVKPPPTSGTITIQKRVTGAPPGENPSFPFNGSLSYNPDGFQLAAGGSQDFFRAGGSTWTVREGSVDGYTLADLSCRAQAPGGGPGASTVDITGPSAAIHLVAGEHVTCVYDNRYVPPRAGLTIRKATLGGVGRFDYRVTPESGGGGAEHARATTIEPHVAVDAVPSLSLTPGRYRIQERAPASSAGHWRSVRVRCDGAQEPRSGPVVVDLPRGGAVTCTFTDAFIPDGSISLAKITQGATGTVSFLVAPLRGPPAQYLQTATTTTPGAEAAAVPRTGAHATDHLRLGSYRITEQAPASASAGAWTLTSVRCDGALMPFEEGTVEVRLTRTHPAMHCVYTDTFSPSPPPPPPPSPPPPSPPPPPPPLPVHPPPISPPPHVTLPEVPGRPEYQLSHLVVTKRASTDSVTRGGVVGYRITVANRGPDPAQGVELADQPLGPASLVSVHTGTGHCRDQIPTICTLDTLAPGARATITLRIRVFTGAPNLINRAVAGTATQVSTLADSTASTLVHVRPPRRRGPPPVGLG